MNSELNASHLIEAARYASFLQEILILMVNDGILSHADFGLLYLQITDPDILATNIKAMKEKQDSPTINAAFHLSNKQST